VTPAGYSAGPSVVDDNAGYMFYKVAAGTESTVSLTFGSTAAILTAASYTGTAAVPFDASNTSSIVQVHGTTTTSTSVTTTAAGDLIVAVATLYDFQTPVGAPTSPSWTNSFVNTLDSDVNPNTGLHGHTFYGELIAGAAGAYSTSCSWTTQMEERQQLIAAFKAAAVSAAASPPFRRSRMGALIQL